MTLRTLGRTSVWLFVVGLTTSHAAGPVAPSIRIVSPTTGFVTSGELSVVVEFNASANPTTKSKAPTGNVQTIALEVNGAAVAELDNPSNVKAGRHTFDVDLSGFSEGPITIEAVAYQGAARAGHAGRSGRATVVIDRDLGDGAVVGSAGGMLGTADGGLRLEIPAGALVTPTSIMATRIDPTGLPRPEGAGPATIAYELEPDGMRFALPVQATLRLDTPATVRDGSIVSSFSVLASVSDGAADVLSSQELSASVNTGESTISGPITHFSKLTDFPIAPGVFASVVDLPDAAIHVDQEFVPTAIVFDNAASKVRADAVYFEDDSEEPIFFPDDGDIRFPGGLDSDEADELKLTLDSYRCSRRGVGAFRGIVKIGLQVGRIFISDYVYTFSMTIACFVPQEGAAGSSFEGRNSLTVDPTEITQTVDLPFDLALKESGSYRPVEGPVIEIFDLIQAPTRIVSDPRLNASSGPPSGDPVAVNDVRGRFHRFAFRGLAGEALQRLEYTCLSKGVTVLAFTMASVQRVMSQPPATVLVVVECTRPKTGALIGPAGGRVSDGMLALHVPPGALASTETIALSRLEAGDLPPALAASATCGAWQLSPAGLEFAAPVEVSIGLDAPRQADGSLMAPGVLLFTHANGTLDALEQLSVDADGQANTTTGSGYLMRLDDTLVCDRGFLSAAVDGLPESVAVGVPFPVGVSAERSAVSDVSAQASYADASAAPMSFLGSGGALGHINGIPMVGADYPYACNAPGPAGLAGIVTFGGVDLALPGLGAFDVDVRFSHSVQCIASPGGQPPVASFTHTCTGRACTFDASGSIDPDGTIEMYSWSFGDGGLGSGSTVSHTFNADGTYTVMLAVEDDDGLTHTAATPVTVSAGPPPGGEGSVLHLTRGGGPFPVSAIFSVEHDTTAPGTLTLLPPQVPFTGTQPGPMDGDHTIIAVGDQGDNTLSNTSTVQFFVRNPTGSWVQDAVVPLDGNFVRDLAFDPTRKFLWVSYSTVVFGGAEEHLAVINVATRTMGAPLTPGRSHTRLMVNPDPALRFVYALSSDQLSVWSYDAVGSLAQQASRGVSLPNDLALKNQTLFIGTNVGEQQIIRLVDGLPGASHGVGIGNTGLFGQAIYRDAASGNVCVYSVSGGGELRIFSANDTLPFIQLTATEQPGLFEFFWVPVAHRTGPFVYVTGDNVAPPPPSPPVPSPFMAVYEIDPDTCLVTRRTTTFLFPPPGPPVDVLAVPQ